MGWVMLGLMTDSTEHNPDGLDVGPGDGESDRNGDGLGGQETEE